MQPHPHPERCALRPGVPRERPFRAHRCRHRIPGPGEGHQAGRLAKAEGRGFESPFPLLDVTWASPMGGVDIVRKLSTIVLEMRTKRMPRQPALPVPPALKALLGSAGRAKLLAHFLLHPGEAFHTRELARLLDESPGSLLRDLRRLETIRLLLVNRV